jgi:hypothetical protein
MSNLPTEESNSLVKPPFSMSPAVRMLLRDLPNRIKKERQLESQSDTQSKPVTEDSDK